MDNLALLPYSLVAVELAQHISLLCYYLVAWPQSCCLTAIIFSAVRVSRTQFHRPVMKPSLDAISNQILRGYHIFGWCQALAHQPRVLVFDGLKTRFDNHVSYTLHFLNRFSQTAPPVCIFVLHLIKPLQHFMSSYWRYKVLYGRAMHSLMCIFQTYLVYLEKFGASLVSLVTALIHVNKYILLITKKHVFADFLKCQL